MSALAFFARSSDNKRPPRSPKRPFVTTVLSKWLGLDQLSFGRMRTTQERFPFSSMRHSPAVILAVDTGFVVLFSALMVQIVTGRLIHARQHPA